MFSNSFRGITLVVALVIASEAKADDGPSKNQYWSRLLSVPMQYDDLPRRTHGEQERYWTEVGITCQNICAAMLADKNGRELAKDFASRFGREGADADVLWALAATPYITGNRGAKVLRDNWQEHETYKLGITLNEQLVSRVLKEPDVGERLWHAVVYGESLLGAGKSSHHSIQFHLLCDNTAQGFELKDRRRAAWFDLNFVYIAIATDRKDLLKDASPMDLPERFASWKKWFETNEPFLSSREKYPGWTLNIEAKEKGTQTSVDGQLPSLNIPMKPFPDLKGMPPNPNVFSQLY